MTYYVFVFSKKNDEIYYKVKDTLYLWRHPLGYTNQYGHKIILIIPISQILYGKRHPFKSFKKKLIKSSIRFLKKFDRD